MLANNAALVQMVRPVMEEMLASDRGDQLRRDLRPKDLAQFFISTSISMLLGVIPGTEDPETVRRYIDVFVLPAVVAHPTPATRVPGLVGTTVVGLDRGRQRHEDPVLADLVDQARGLERVPQILLHPRHREHDSAASQFTS